MEQKIAVDVLDLAELRRVARRTADRRKQPAAHFNRLRFSLALGLPLGRPGQIGNVGDERLAFLGIQVEALGGRLGPLR